MKKKNERVVDFVIQKKEQTIIALRIKINDPESSFIVLIDSVNCDYSLFRLNSKERILLLKIDDSSDISKIQVYLISEARRSVLFEYYNNEVWKFFYRLNRLSVRMFSKTISLVQIVKKGFMIVWTKHRLIIPINMWSQYYRNIKLRIRNDGNRPFFHIWNKEEYNNFVNSRVLNQLPEEFNYNPKISIILPVFNVEPQYLKECIESVLSQTYKHIELCIVDDSSTRLDTIETLLKYENESRVKIKFRSSNGHICNASNDALEMATGEFIGLLDNDDVLDLNACAEIVNIINSNPEIDFIYTDEDKIDESGVFCDPHFKPDYSPDTFCSLNYLSHFSVIRKSRIQDVGSFVVGTEGAQDYDLYFRILEVTKKIHHIPKVLYHWRKIPGSTSLSIDQKQYAVSVGKKVIERHFNRINIKVNVRIDQDSNYYIVDYLLNHEPSISIVIPTKDNYLILNDCLDSIYKFTSYRNFEILIISNNSTDQKTFDLFNRYSSEHSNFKVIYDNSEFNYAKINNCAAFKCKSEYLLFLNNDTKVTQTDWLSNLVGYASQSHVGAVGAKLIYNDETIQHCGVVLGVGGVASHAFLNDSINSKGIYGRLVVPYNYSAVTGACLLISKSKFEEVGGFDENLRIAYNDVDLCLKLLRNGYFNVVLSNVILYHYESKTRGYDTTIEKYNLFMKESNYMYNKWNYLLDNDPFYNLNYSKNTCFLLDKKEFDLEKWMLVNI